MDTIFALATAQGRSGVGIVRISGDQAFNAAGILAGRLPKARGIRKLRGKNGDILDEALVLVFERGHSFTGEPVVELQLHGSMAITRAVLRRLGEMPELRLAEPGEFTRRAWENGRLDLAQVEGLADLIEAETEAQRIQALRVFSGDLGKKVEIWRKDLLHAAALLAAVIDFSDDEVPEDVSEPVLEIIEKVSGSLKSERDGFGVAERIRDGFEVAIVGPPNAGKSTLLNRLAGREAAITSQLAGTTRDVIEVRMDLGGLPVTLLDTAGIRDTSDVLEEIGISRSRERAERADLRIFLRTSDGEDIDLEAQPEDIIVMGKGDLRSEGFRVSGKTGEGLDKLIDLVQKTLENRTIGAGTVIRQRHVDSIERALDSLREAEKELQYGVARAELAAFGLHGAINALNSLVGRVDIEQVLDEVFSNFCLGK